MSYSNLISRDPMAMSERSVYVPATLSEDERIEAAERLYQEEWVRDYPQWAEESGKKASLIFGDSFIEQDPDWNPPITVIPTSPYTRVWRPDEGPHIVVTVLSRIQIEE